MTDFLKSKWRRLTASARITILLALSLTAGILLIFAGHASSQSPGADGAQSVSSNEIYIAWGDTNFLSGDDILSDDWPDWAMYAYKVGGEWSTNEDRPCWQVAASDTNSAQLHVELERMVLTTDVFMGVTFFDQTNSALYVDLYDEDENVLAENLFGNLITGSNVDTTVLLDIPLAAFPDAVGISLSRGTGSELTVYESLLYVTNQNPGSGQDGGSDLAGDNILVPRVWVPPVNSGTAASSASDTSAPASGATDTSSESTTAQGFSMGGGMQPMMLGANSGSYGNWNYEMPITFPGYNKTETLTNFPVLVMLSTNLSGFAYSQFASSSGYDLRFAASDQTTELNYEFENWDTGDTSYVWVQVPALTSNTYIWAFWGNPDSSVTSSPAIYTTNGATWDNTFAAVWHMNQTNALDSTANGNNGTAQGGGITQTNGLSGQGYSFDGSSWIQVPDSASLRGMTNLTVSFWLKGTRGGVPLSRRGNSGGDNPYGYIAYEAYGSSVLDNWYEGNGSWNTASLEWSDSGSWHYYCFSGSGGTASSYKDGQCLGSAGGFAQGPFPTLPAGHQNLCIGTDNLDPNSSGSTDKRLPSGCAMDEVRVENAGRSSNWLWACWLNMASNSAFTGYGEIQGEAQGAPTIDNDGGASNITITTATLNGTLTSTSGAPTTVYVYWGPTDGGTDQGSWMNSSNLGVLSTGLVSCNVTGLVGETAYYYSFYATNGYGDAWAGQSSSFTTLLDPNSYLYKLSISFPGYTRSEPLTNFPALVAFTTNLSGFAYSQFAAANGYELRFMDSSQTAELNYEFENWDTGNTSYVWVQVPALTSNTSIWAFWGNSNSCVTSSPAVYTINGATWSQGYAAVWHLNETPTGAAGEILDSTTNANDGTTVGGMGSGNSMLGRVDHALNFNGSSQRVDCENSNSLQLATGTLEAWVNTANPGLSYRGILTKQNAYGMFLDTGVFVIYDWGGTIERSSGISLADSQWHYVAATFNSGAVGGTVLYVDGVQKLTTEMTVLDQSVEAQIADGHSAQYLNGAIDEARISSAYRSSNWIWACWLNMASNSVFTTFGSLAYTSRDENDNGIPDGWEMQYFGNLNQPANGSYNNNGVSNLKQYERGTDPTLLIPQNITVHVNSTAGNDANYGVSPDPAAGILGPMATLPAATAWAINGDTIQLASGTYAGMPATWDFRNTQVTIVWTGNVVIKQ